MDVCAARCALRRARDIGLSAGLHYVYEGNIPGYGHESTTCPACRTVVVERHGFTVRVNRLRNGCCPACRTRIDGIEMNGVNRRPSAA